MTVNIIIGAAVPHHYSTYETLIVYDGLGQPKYFDKISIKICHGS
jgi:hypothetical protein